MRRGTWCAFPAGMATRFSLPGGEGRVAPQERAGVGTSRAAAWLTHPARAPARVRPPLRGGKTGTRRPSPVRGRSPRWLKELISFPRGERDAGSPALFERYVRVGCTGPSRHPAAVFSTSVGAPNAGGPTEAPEAPVTGTVTAGPALVSDNGARCRPPFPPPETSERFIGIKAAIVKVDWAPPPPHPPPSRGQALRCGAKRSLEGCRTVRQRPARAGCVLRGSPPASTSA
jgi:hypothetical protein